MRIDKLFLTNNDCYKSGRTITPQGIVVHSTGVNQKKVGVFLKNWNKGGVNVCVHAFIGVLDDGSIGIVQTLPWNMRCWGVGKGKKGSYNNTHIQFEICEDALKDRAYFDQVFGLAVKLCAKLCRRYNIPASSIVSHAEAHRQGYGSNHADCDHWLKRFGKTMYDFRWEVQTYMQVQTTVDNMISDGVTTEPNRESWELFLNGKAEMNPVFVKTILDRYHDKLEALK